MSLSSKKAIAVAPIGEIPESICHGCAFIGSIDCAKKNATAFYETHTGIKIPTKCPNKLLRSTSRINNRGESVPVFDHHERKHVMVKRKNYKK